MAKVEMRILVVLMPETCAASRFPPQAYTRRP